MIEILALATNETIEAARAGATLAGHFSPLNTLLSTAAIGMLGVILRYQITNRKLSIGVNGEVRKEILDQLGALRADNDGLRDEIRTLRRENDALRDEVRGLHGVIDGMRREGLAGQISAQRIVADMMPQSPAMDRALRSLGDLQGDAKP